MPAQTDIKVESGQPINKKQTRVKKTYLFSTRLFEILELFYGTRGVWDDAKMEIMKITGFQFSCLSHAPLHSIGRL